MNHLPEPASAPSTLPNAFAELVQQWASLPYDDVGVDYGTYFKNNPTLHRFLNLGACLTWIIDMRTLHYTFISSNVKQILGYDAQQFLSKGVPFVSQIMHPADLAQTSKVVKIIWDFLRQLPADQRQKYRFSGDYRILKPDGSCVRILEQNTVLQLDRKGNITHLLGTGSDITYWKRNNDMLALVVSLEDGTCFFCSPEDTCLNSQATLSRRELEILKLIAAGYNSKLIADKLYISFHTVNTHRQHIIEKTKTKNASGLIQFAIYHGLI